MTQAVKLAQLGSPGISTGFKNRIINGAMVIDQRNAGATGTSSSYTVDRFRCFVSQANKITWGQNYGSVTPPTGFAKYLGFKTTTAYTSGATDRFMVFQPIEGYNIADLGWGTANAKTVTLSFQVYSSVTGTHSGAITNGAGDRSYPFTFTVSSANTWTSISVTIAGDTSGTWTTDNTEGLSVYFNLGTGSTYLGTANAWAAGYYLGVTGSVNIVSTLNNTFYITGVQLEVGTTATDFEYRPYGTELALCQRYYYLHVNGISQASSTAWYYSSTSASTLFFLPVTMRTRPTFEASAGTDYYAIERNGGTDTVNSFSYADGYTNSIRCYNNSEASGTAGVAGFMYTNNASAKIAFNAEL